MSKKERKLTKAEEKRKKIYEEEKQKLIEQGYTEKDLTISVVYANVMAFVLGLPIIIVLGILFFNNNFNSSRESFMFTMSESFIFLSVMSIPSTIIFPLVASKRPLKC